MNDTIRTTPVKYGTSPYVWGVESVYQCTWYAYYRAIEKGLSAPCWWDRATKTGSYTNAKLWIKEYRDPWIPMPVGYSPVEGDIVVFDGAYGHVAFIEKLKGNNIAMLSQYMSGKEDSFSNKDWQIGTAYTGQLLGYLHYDNVKPVKRNKEVNQVEVKTNILRVRNQPSLNGDILGFADMGYYNVLSQSYADSYTWYEIEKNKYIANVDTKYYPASIDNDIITQVKKFAQDVQIQIDNLNNDNSAYRKKLEEINELSKV